MILRTARFPDLDATTLYALLRLRVDVFVVEQRCPYPELDGRDVEPRTVHAWLDDGGTVAAYLRILTEPEPEPEPGTEPGTENENENENRTDPGTARIGRVCTDPAYRGRGLSARLLTAALDLIGDRPTVLDAQSYLAAFYARFGFEITGPEFVEDGIPHLPMRRTYGNAATISPIERRRPV